MPVALQPQGDFLAALILQRPAEVLEGLDVGAIDGRDEVAHSDAGLHCRHAWLEHHHPRGRPQGVAGGDVDGLREPEEENEVEDEGKAEAGQRPRPDNDGAFPRRLGEKPARWVLLAALVAEVPGHLHVAAEWNPRHLVLGLAAGEGKNARPEPDGKARHLHIQRFGGEKVAQLVRKNEHAEQDDEVNRVLQEHVGTTVAAPAPADNARPLANLEGVPEEGHVHVQHRYVEEQCVNAVENAPMARDEKARVLGAGGALQHRLAEVSQRAEDSAGNAEHHAVQRREYREDEARDEEPTHRPEEASGKAFPRLVRAHRRVKLVPAEGPPDEVGTGVIGPGHHQRGDDPRQPVRAGAQRGQAGRAPSHRRDNR